MKKFILLFTLLFTTPIKAKEVILGGDSIGLQINYQGLLITSTYTVNTNDKSYNPASDDILKGDTIIAINGTKIETIEDFMEVTNKYKNKQVVLTLYRNSKIIYRNLDIIEDNNKIRTGLFLKDEIVGIGTLTYIDPETNIFASLGHEILDQDTNKIILMHKGTLYSSSVQHLKKAQITSTGEKQAQIKYDIVLGDIHKVNVFGVYGESKQINDNQMIETATQDEILLDKAVMYTVLKDELIEEIEVKINRKYKQNQPMIKSFEFEIIDQETLIQTNGILQGMSGSPIVQNDKLIGAVTHVSGKNPTKGYGIYIEWMLEESD